MSAITSDATPPSPVLARVAPVYGVVGISYLGYAMMATLFVPMILSPGSTYAPEGSTAGQRAMLVGLLLMLYPMAQVIGSPVLGALSDRYGRRPVLVASLAVTTIAYALIASALAMHMLWLLGAALILCGLGEANAAIGTSAIADATTKEERPKYLGYLWSVTSVSYVLGPVLGGFAAAHFGYLVPFAAMVGVLAATFLLVLLFFRETRAPDPSARQVPIGSSLGNLVLLPMLVGRIDMRRLGILSTLIGAFGVFLALLPGGVAVAVGFGGLASIAFAVGFSALSGLLSAKVGPERQGAVMGNNTALGFLGEGIGVMGGSALTGITPELPMILFGLIAFASVAVVRFAIPREEPAASP